MTDPNTIPEFFLQRYSAATADQRADAIRAAVACGFGSWLSPDSPASLHHPATHLVEIDLFGVSATGDCIDSAVAHWFTLAARALAPQVAA